MERKERQGRGGGCHLNESHFTVHVFMVGQWQRATNNKALPRKSCEDHTSSTACLGRLIFARVDSVPLPAFTSALAELEYFASIWNLYYRKEYAFGDDLRGARRFPKTSMN